MKQAETIKELKNYTQQNLNKAREFAQLPQEKLKKQPAEGSWSALQCMEHLNLYGDFYLREIENKVRQAKKLHQADRNFKPGFFGKLFTGMMLPGQNGPSLKMKTFADKNPDASHMNEANLERFIRQQQKWLEILDSAREVNLNKNACKLTLPLLKMNLGATLQFVIYHNVRHVQQAERAIG